MQARAELGVQLGVLSTHYPLGVGSAAGAPLAALLPYCRRIVIDCEG